MDIVNALAAFFEFIAPFGSIRLLSLALVLLGLWLGLQRTAYDRHTQILIWFAVAVPLLLWLALVWQSALAGVFQPGWSRVPLIPAAIFLPLLLALMLLMRSSHIAAVMDVAPPSWLVGIQVFRIFGGVFLVRWMLGELPGTFALPAGIGDVLVGVLALPVAYLLHTGAKGSRQTAFAFNILGITDFAIAITTGILTALRILPVEQSNIASTTFPLVMIPAFSVPFYLIVHSLSLWQLRRIGRKDIRSTRSLAAAARGR